MIKQVFRSLSKSAGYNGSKIVGLRTQTAITTCRTASTARHDQKQHLHEESALVSDLDLYAHPTQSSILVHPPPRRFSEFTDEALALLASQGVHGAFKERMLREIMRVDGIPYSDAYIVLAEMNKKNEEYRWLFKIPFQVGLSSAFLAGVASVPAVFDRDTAIWFCTNFVKEEVPPADQLDTVWKVGTWTWQWMEPMIGTASFVLLAFQLVRTQMQQIALKPYYNLVISYKADRLTDAFPRYEREVVRDYAKSDPWGRDTHKARKGHPANSVIGNHQGYN